MNIFNNSLKNLTPSENYLLVLLRKIISEYKKIQEYNRNLKLFKIIQILYLSDIPGETKFAIQISKRNIILELTAGEIINQEYSLKDFNDFHAEMITKAAEGRLVEFLSIDNRSTTYKIISKKYDYILQQNIFFIEASNGIKIARTADELAKDTKLLSCMNFDDIFDIGYTQGSESILKEKIKKILREDI